MAEIDLESALHQLGSITGRADRDAFLKGVFAFAAGAHSVRDIFNLAATLEDADRPAALFSALDTLTEGRGDKDGKATRFAARFGVEAGIGMALALDPIFRPEHADAWIEAFGDLDSRGVMIGSFASLRAVDDPQAALAMGAQMTGWDRELFLRSLGDGWSQKDPLSAWNWALENALLSEPGGMAILGSVLKNWGTKDFEAADRAFQQLSDPEQRISGAQALARVRTWNSGTAAAVQWANQLPSEDEKDVAHAAIAEHSPQGIGAALSAKDGYTVVAKLIPQGAAARDGRLQEGDRIIEVDPGTGRFQDLYGRDLTQALDLIRGDAGSTVRLRVVRQDENGVLRDQVMELTREQIVMEGG